VRKKEARGVWEPTFIELKNSIAGGSDGTAKGIGGTASSGSGVIQFMSETSGNFSEGDQFFTLLIGGSGFPDAVGQQADETLMQNRYVFQHFREVIFVEPGSAGLNYSVGGGGIVCEPRIGQQSGYLAGTHDKDAAVASLSAYLPAEKDGEVIGRFAGTNEYAARLQVEGIHAVRQPLKLFRREV
jgi:hypothetical protein